MAKILISLLSDHIIPNYLFIKETERQFDDYIFIGTKYTFDKEFGINLENTLQWPLRKTRRIVVSNDNYNVIMRELENEQFSHDDEYCINQTGGTKAMSIAVFSFFQNFKTKFVYIPFGTNEYFDFEHEEGMKIKYRLNLKEYFSLYGMTYESDNNFLLGAKSPENVFYRLMKRKFYLLPDIIKAHEKPTPEERRFWSGEWFEEYTFKRILQEYSNVSDKAIGKSVKVFRKGSIVNDNEIDVAFVKDNNLYMIECKVSMNGYGSTTHDTIEKYLYKIAAIMKDLGLKVNSYLFTLHNMSRLNPKTLENIEKRKSILGIKGLFDGPRLTKMLNI